MSLLLDALKKAAQEKQNADSADIEADAGAGLSLKQDVEAPSYNKPDTQINDSGVHEELELEFDDDAFSSVSSKHEDIIAADEENFHHTDRSYRLTSTPSTVTDEALQLLINKTNQEHKKSRILTWGGIATGALVLLSISGLYFYSSMMDDIESMQRKHQIALAALKSKTKIEENLTSLAVVPEQNKQATADTAASKGNTTKTATRNRPVNRPASGKKFSVQRAEIHDPVSEELQRGWSAYQNKDYKSSRRAYENVLENEPDNHDALLGIAAVSLQQDDADTARDIYIRLLERDPRDPHAHAGLANIAQIGGSSLSESKLKQLIEFRPDDSHLQFALGNLYVQKQSWPEAQQAFFNAWKADNSNPDYAYNLAVSLDQLGKHKEAKVYYEESLKLAAGKNINFSPGAVEDRLVYLGTL